MTKSNPCVLYTGDNEGPAVMRLETLIANFNASGGWQYRHNEEDMRLELDSRGWYSGLHDNGHYLAVNMDKLQMMPHPSLYEKPGAVHPDLGGTPRPVPQPPAQGRSAFFTWFDAVNANAAKNAAGAFMRDAGYTIAHTGGGCLAWEKKADTAPHWSVWICDEGNGLGIEELGEAFQTAAGFMCQLCHDESGEFITGPQESTIGECMAWATRALADVDAMRIETVLADLAEHNGAILNWQVHGDLADAYRQALAAGAIKMESDCYVHPLATRVSESGWEMPQ